MANAENANPSCVLLTWRSTLISGSAVAMLTRLTKYRKYIAHNNARTTAGAPGFRLTPWDARRP